jgi:hypothetical protein
MAIDYFAQQFGKDVVEDTTLNQVAPQTVEDLYASVGRTPDAEGKAFWEGAFGTGPVTAEQAASFMESANAVKAKEAAVTDTSTNTGGITNLINTGATDNTTANGINSLLDTNTSTAVDAPNYRQMVIDAYGTIGRTGIGGEKSNIDQAGLDYWINTLQSGASTPEAFNRNFQTAVTDYIAQNPNNEYSQYVKNYLGLPDTTSTTTNTSGLNNNNVDAFGDSTTYGYNAGNQLTSNMVTSAQSTLGNDYTINNRGVNSTTAGDLLNNVDGSNSWANSLASNSGVIVLNYGLNEASRGESP